MENHAPLLGPLTLSCQSAPVLLSQALGAGKGPVSLLSHSQPSRGRVLRGPFRSPFVSRNAQGRGLSKAFGAQHCLHPRFQPWRSWARAGRDPHGRPCSHREGHGGRRPWRETPVPQAFCDGVWGASQEPLRPLGCSGHCQDAVLWRDGRERVLAVPQVHPPSTDPETGRAGPPSGLQQEKLRSHL